MQRQKFCMQDLYFSQSRNKFHIHLFRRNNVKLRDNIRLQRLQFQLKYLKQSYAIEIIDNTTQKQSFDNIAFLNNHVKKNPA